jgi:demethylmenaquinone methyltransferase/2-methoxy-6-polyprenyl-1,4-benzoquinol methylase
VESERATRRGPGDDPTAIAPHPVLDRYYPDAAARQTFVTALFDGGARHYDRVCRFMSLGSGQWYRKQALVRAGLRPGMTMLDVATGTGLVARSALQIVSDGAVVGIDPSAGMLREARSAIGAALVQGRAESLPFASDRFDVLAIGYALRHVGDLDVAFAECRRVLRPGGSLLVLEISRPPSPASRALLRFYFRPALPGVMRLYTRSEHARLLTRYYWDTIEACVPPATILDVMRRTGFGDVGRVVWGGFLSEYRGIKPRAAASRPADRAA